MPNPRILEMTTGTPELLRTRLLTTEVEHHTGLSRKDSTRRQIGRHESAVVIEQFVAAHPLKTQDLLYPTNMMVATTPTHIVHHPSPGLTKLERKQYVRELQLESLLESLPPQKIAGFVTVAVFAGYAALFSLQHVIKTFFKIPDDDSRASHEFSFAITSMYIWNLIFRIGHNFILYSFTPRIRALCGLGSMAVAMALLGIAVFHFEFRSIPLVAVAYAFGGVGIGVFETNYSVVLAGLGNKTKIYGISGIPVGIFLVIVPGFIAVASGMPVVYVYYSVLVMLAIGFVILLGFIEYPILDALLSEDLEWEEPTEEKTLEQSAGTKSKNWALKVASVGFVFTVNMLCVSAFSPGVLLYLYNTGSVEMASSMAMPTGYFFALFSSFGFVADVISRRRIYEKKPESHPIRYLVFTFIGTLIILSQTPLIAPIGTFFIFFANGSIYAQSCRWLDLQLDESVLVMASSIFFFLGDCGSVMGAILIPFIRDAMAANP